MLALPEIIEVIEQMKLTGSDSQRCEVKESVRELPKSLLETLSAFANGNGGVVILGLSEKNGFVPAKGFDAQKIHTSAMAVGDYLSPIVRPEIEIFPYQGAKIVVMLVNELPIDEKPCYVTNKGIYQGSFIRTGDGDRRLSKYEIDRLRESSRQPLYDIEPIQRAKREDLNPIVLANIVRRQRTISPRILASRMTDDEVLVRIGVLAQIGGQLYPTLAGLLVACDDPQRYFPRLCITFTVYLGTTKEADSKSGVRFLETRTLIGSIPDMLSDCLALVEQYMKTASVVKGKFREDVPDYPILAVREAVANALQHRDYSPEGRSTQIQVNMYADRLEIENPGGLYGATTVEDLIDGVHTVSSSRNVYLSRLLETTPFQDGYVVENRGSGYVAIRSELSKAQMPQPRVRNTISYFVLTFEKRDVVQERISQQISTSLEKDIVQALEQRNTLSTSDLLQISGKSRTAVYACLKKLLAQGKIETTEPFRSPKQRYRLTSSSVK